MADVPEAEVDSVIVPTGFVLQIFKLPEYYEFNSFLIFVKCVKQETEIVESTIMQH